MKTEDLAANRQKFRDMLKERKVKAFSTWERELPKFLTDPRYQLLDMDDRKRIFQDFVRNIALEERKEKSTQKKQQISAFNVLLDELAEELTANSTIELLERYSDDARFQALEGKERQQLFNQRLLPLKEAAEKRKVEDRASELTAAKKYFAEANLTSWSRLKTKLSEEGELPRFPVLGEDGLEAEFRAWLKEREAVEEALRQRELEANSLRKKAERDFRDIRKQQSVNEDQNEFLILLVEKVKDERMRYHDFIDSLPRDVRIGGRLSRDEKRELFDKHVAALSQQRVTEFRNKCKDIIADNGLTIGWLKAQPLLKKEWEHIKPAEQEKQFELIAKQMKEAALESFYTFLKSVQQISEHTPLEGPQYEQAIELLRGDPRFEFLNTLPEERNSVIQNHIKLLRSRANKRNQT